MARTILSIGFDSQGAIAVAFEWNGELTKLPQRFPPKDVRETIRAASGSAVATLIGNYVREAQSILGNRRFDDIAVSAPGAIDVAKGVFLKSTRLGVREEFDFRAFLRDRYAIATTLINDADAAAIGEARYSLSKTANLRPSADLRSFGDFSYVLVSEGIGCSLFIEGRRYVGAGAAAHIGRMTIDPSGPFSERFSSRGPLESYASREAISRQIVAEFRSAKDKTGSRETLARFDQIVSAVEEWGDIPASDIARAVADGHPIAIAAVDEASHYLGIAIGALVTIMNPPTVIVGGDMIQSTPRYFTKTVEAAERFTWSAAWNKTRLLQGALADASLWGAAHLVAESKLP